MLRERSMSCLQQHGRKCHSTTNRNYDVVIPQCSNEVTLLQFCVCWKFCCRTSRKACWIKLSYLFCVFFVFWCSLWHCIYLIHIHVSNSCDMYDIFWSVDINKTKVNHYHQCNHRALTNYYGQGKTDRMKLLTGVIDDGNINEQWYIIVTCFNENISYSNWNLLEMTFSAMSVHVMEHVEQQQWCYNTSGARPTKHISIEFEIRWKFRML